MLEWRSPLLKVMQSIAIVWLNVGPTPSADVGSEIGRTRFDGAGFFVPENRVLSDTPSAPPCASGTSV